jgi:hypothetical protein
MRDYDEAWNEIRDAQAAVIIIFATYMPAQLLVAPLLAHVLPSSVAAGGMVFVIWGVGIAASVMYLTTRRCPRCRKGFFQKGLYHNLFGQKCLHCGLRKYASADEAENRRG